jgi:hypothetical protein
MDKPLKWRKGNDTMVPGQSPCSNSGWFSKTTVMIGTRPQLDGPGHQIIF